MNCIMLRKRYARPKYLLSLSLAARWTCAVLHCHGAPSLGLYVAGGSTVARVAALLGHLLLTHTTTRQPTLRLMCAAASCPVVKCALAIMQCCLSAAFPAQACCGTNW